MNLLTFLDDMVAFTPSKIYDQIYYRSRKSVNEASKRSVGTFLGMALIADNFNSKDKFKIRVTQEQRELLILLKILNTNNLYQNQPMKCTSLLMKRRNYLNLIF